MALCGRFGEKELDGGLSLMADALKIFRAVPIELALRLLDGRSSRPLNSRRVEEACGVPRRLAGALPMCGDAVVRPRFANGRGGRDLGVELCAPATSLSPGREKVTIFE
jgi:hypothetical protein